VKRIFILGGHPEARGRAAAFVLHEAPDGYAVTVAEAARNAEQSAKFHAICGDLEKSGLLWRGKPRTDAEWKVLLVSAHATATKEGSEVVDGLEGEMVNIRESTALMSVRRSSSLIEYSVAFCVVHGVKMSEGSK
jgi:hypothetical protein